jgi:serine/threonine-protein kinase
MRPGSVILTQEGMVFGTPEFMSPEQAQGKPLTPASDVYSLAVILYEVLTGKLPFDAKSAMDFIQLHVGGKPIPLNQRVPGRTFPPLLEQIMDRALSKRPEDRFSSAAELAAALQQVPQTATESPPAVAAGPAGVAAAKGPPVASLPARGHQPHALATPATRALPVARRPRASNGALLLVGVAAAFLLIGIGLAVALMRLMKVKG